MNATMAVSTTKKERTAVTSVQRIPLDKICESKTNPRIQFDERRLAESVDIIEVNGLAVQA